MRHSSRSLTEVLGNPGLIALISTTPFLLFLFEA